MINSILEAVSIAINAEFGDDYTIYTESVEQGLNEPCFFLSCVNPASRVFLGKRYFKENKFCIQFFPSDKERAKEECNSAAERLFSCLEYINIDGDLVRGTKMKCETADGILNFFVNYNLFVYIDKNIEFTPIEGISENISVKG